MHEHEKLTHQKWLEELGKAGMLADKITQSLSLFACKRTTLEEKIIASHLWGLLAGIGQIVYLAAASLKEGDGCSKSDCPNLLGDLNSQATAVIDELLKAARYNPNFLEQYFEHDFCRRLREDCCFVEKSEQIVDSLIAISGKRQP